MKKTRRQRRALARKVANIANNLYYAEHKAELLAKQKAIRDDRRADIISANETITPTPP